MGRRSPGRTSAQGCHLYRLGFQLAEELEYQTLDHTAVDMSDVEALDRIEMQLKKAQRMGVDDSYRPQGPPSANKGQNNLLACADTIPELAEKLGLTGTDREHFIASVARYNELAHKGRDEDFAKDPRQLHHRAGPVLRLLRECPGRRLPDGHSLQAWWWWRISR